MDETMYDSHDSMPWNQSEDLNFDAARAEWERGQDQSAAYANYTAEVERLRSDAEADRLGTAGLRDYIRQLEGLLRDLEAAWKDHQSIYPAIDDILEQWTRIDPERQG